MTYWLRSYLFLFVFTSSFPECRDLPAIPCATCLTGPRLRQCVRKTSIIVGYHRSRTLSSEKCKKSGPAFPNTVPLRPVRNKGNRCDCKHRHLHVARPLEALKGISPPARRRKQDVGVKNGRKRQGYFSARASAKARRRGTCPHRPPKERDAATLIRRLTDAALQQFVTSWREKTRTPIRSGRSALRTPCGGGWAVGSLTMLVAKRLYKSGVNVRTYG